jgi:hypothetical protein
MKDHNRWVCRHLPKHEQRVFVSAFSAKWSRAWDELESEEQSSRKHHAKAAFKPDELERRDRKAREIALFDGELKRLEYLSQTHQEQPAYWSSS